MPLHKTVLLHLQFVNKKSINVDIHQTTYVLSLLKTNPP